MCTCRTWTPECWDPLTCHLCPWWDTQLANPYCPCLGDWSCTSPWTQLLSASRSSVLPSTCSMYNGSAKSASWRATLAKHNICFWGAEWEPQGCSNLLLPSSNSPGLEDVTSNGLQSTVFGTGNALIANLVVEDSEGETDEEDDESRV